MKVHIHDQYIWKVVVTIEQALPLLEQGFTEASDFNARATHPTVEMSPVYPFFPFTEWIQFS